MVNIITRSQLRGARRLNVYTGTLASAGDGTVYSIDGTTGKSSDRGSILFSIGYFGQESAFAGEREYSGEQRFYDATGLNSPTGKIGQYPVGSGTIPKGRFVLSPAKVYGAPIANPDNDPRIARYNQLMTQFPKANSFIRDAGTPLVGGPSKALSSTRTGTTTCPREYLSTPQKRIQLFSSGDTRLGNWSRAYFEAAFVNRQSDQRLAPEPLLTNQAGVLISKDNAYNPFGIDIPAFRRRLLEFGPRQFSQDINTDPSGHGPRRHPAWRRAPGRVVLGPLPRLWPLDGHPGVPRLAAHDPDSERGESSFTDETGVLRCGTPGAPIDGCVPLNLFGGDGTITPDQAQALTYDGVLRSFNQLTTAQFNTSGELLQALRLAAGRSRSGLRAAVHGGREHPQSDQRRWRERRPQRAAHPGSLPRQRGLRQAVDPGDQRPGAAQEPRGDRGRAYHFNTFGSGVTYKVGGLWQQGH